MQETAYQLIDAIHQVGLNPGNITKLFISHGHFDHCGAARIIQEMTGCEIWLGKDDQFFFTERRDLIHLEHTVPEFKITNTYEITIKYVIDASGCIISPGLIDFHLHLSPLAEIGVCGEAACFHSGVTTVVDCGSAGVGTYEGHRPALAASRFNVYIFLHVCSAGLATGSYLENPDPQYFNKRKIIDSFKKWQNQELIGLKIRQGKEIVGSLGLEPLKKTINIAEELNVPVMVHCSNPPGMTDEILNLLRSGDILTHAFQDQGSSILGKDGLIVYRDQEF